MHPPRSIQASSTPADLRLHSSHAGLRDPNYKAERALIHDSSTSARFTIPVRVLSHQLEIRNGAIYKHQSPIHLTLRYLYHKPTCAE